VFATTKKKKREDVISKVDLYLQLLLVC